MPGSPVQVKYPFKGFKAGEERGITKSPPEPSALESQPRFLLGIFLQNYAQHCADIPMTPIECVVDQVNVAIDQNQPLASLLVQYVSEEVQDLGIRAIAMSLKHLDKLQTLAIAGTRM